MKVSTITSTIKGTVMHDKMKQYHLLNNSLQEQIQIAKNHNENIKQDSKLTKYSSMEMEKMKDNMENESTGRSITDQEENTPIVDMVNESKKRRREEKENDEEKATSKRLKTSSTKNNKKVIRKNKENNDMETDEKDFIWEIDRDWSLKYYRRNNMIKTKRAIWEVESLENYRKRLGHEGELLLQWKDGRREWIYTSAAKHDAKAAMFNDALRRFNLTKEMMDYGLTRKQIEEDKKNNQKLKDKNKKKGNKMILIFLMILI